METVMQNPSITKAASAVVFIGLLIPTPRVLALPVSLGSAGPGDWAVLETGYAHANANVSIANASGAGFITGNFGVHGTGGNISDSGTPITGNVYVSTTDSVNPNVAPNVHSGFGVIQNSSGNAVLAAASADAIAAWNAAKLLATSGGGVGLTTINYNDGHVHTLAPGVYNLTDLKLQSHSDLVLTAGGPYVFNISGTLALNSSQIRLSSGLAEANVLFDVEGSQAVQFSGGLSQESVLHGIILAPDAQVSIAPGLVVGEIISGDNVSIASGAQVEGVSVPDVGSSSFLMAVALGGLGLMKRRFSATE